MAGLVGRDLRFVQLPIVEMSQVGDARRQAAAFADSLGLCDTSKSDLAIVVTELASNLARHASDGWLQIRATTLDGVDAIEALSIDRGPGIAQLDECLRDGFSTKGSSGTGLGAVRRLSSSWDIYSRPGLGTVQVATVSQRKNLPTKSTRFRIGVIVTPAPGERTAGDTWAVSIDGGVVTIMAADGLGHGESAAAASIAAAEVFREAGRSSLNELLAAMHRRLRSTRGAAISLGRFEDASRRLQFAGVGNVSAFASDGSRTQRFVTMNGTVGCEPLKTREFAYQIDRSGVIVFHSDGLTTRTDVNAYPGLVERHPAVIAGVLHRDFLRGKDDAMVVVLSHG